ncbi:hypothetical protein AALA22_08060 [Anaerovoracaceae bacterium 41-7]|uniref:S10 family peptidase n=1 Tax=Senimuribacter intestinalis TaxID=2941507 RepID=UPI00203F783C|nr:hypothetical protein [Senimuribacter intestinalis]
MENCVDVANKMLHSDDSLLYNAIIQIMEEKMLKMQQKPFEPVSFVREGTVKIEGTEIPYKVISEDNVLTSEAGEPVGSIFTYSYFRTDISEEEAKKRPVLFAFNGGPASSSIWIHWGLISPKKIDFENPIDPQQVAPYTLVNNDRCLLDICDMVLLDPVTCGYGVLIDPKAASEFFGTDQDAAAMALVIEQWLIKHHRMNAPKYLMGESYGTQRASVLVNALMCGPTFQNKACTGIAINGIILMGTILPADPSLHALVEGSMEDCVLNLPTMAATRYYHEPVEGVTQEEFIDDCYTFAADAYLRALYLGNRLPKEELAACIQKLSYFTGIPESWFSANGLRITAQQFPKIYGETALGKVVGVYDSRFTMDLHHGLQLPDPVADDGAMGKYTAYYAGIMSGVGKELLGIDVERPYKVINFDTLMKWNHQAVRTPLLSMQEALRRNPQLRVLVANGIYDLCTPMGNARYSFSQIASEPGQVVIKDYPSGHMTYVGEESYEMLTKDLHEFIK